MYKYKMPIKYYLALLYKIIKTSIFIKKKRLNI